MKLKNKILTVTALFALSQYVHAVPFTFDGRSLGMGGTTVATADLASAAWANPAMLTNQRPDDDFSLLIGIGMFARDNGDLLTDVDAFQAANDRRVAGLAENTPAGLLKAANAVTDMSNIVSGIEGKDVAVDVSGVAAVGIAFDSFAMALSLRSDSIAAGTVTDLSCSVISDPACTIDRAAAEITSTDFNKLNLEGVIATEFGVSFAKAFKVLDRKLSVGIKPKMVDLQRFSYTESILTIDGIDSVMSDGLKSDLGTFTSIDLGLAYELTESFRLGLNIRNLISDKFVIGSQTLNFDTGARMGLAYHNSFVTVAVDYDLIENKPLLANPTFGDLKTQFLAVGAEFNAFDFMQLRVGASRNMASGISDQAKNTALTAGLGFWLGFNLDMAVTYTSNSIGGFLQTGFRF